MLRVEREDVGGLGVLPGCSERETMDYETFTREYGDDLDEIAERNASMSYGELGNWFSTGRLHLLCEHATGYLLLKSLYLEMEKKAAPVRRARVASRVNPSVNSPRLERRANETRPNRSLDD